MPYLPPNPAASRASSRNPRTPRDAAAPADTYSQTATPEGRALGCRRRRGGGSLRYAHLFDSTVRAEYERALDLAKGRIGAMPTPTGRPRIPVTANGGCTSDDDWRDAPAIKARLAGGHCLRAPAHRACPYANICEHCPSFRTDAASAAVLSAQRVDTQALLADAQTRGWIDEADRHRRLLDRLDTLIANTA